MGKKNRSRHEYLSEQQMLQRKNCRKCGNEPSSDERFLNSSEDERKSPSCKNFSIKKLLGSNRKKNESDFDSELSSNENSNRKRSCHNRTAKLLELEKSLEILSVTLSHLLRESKNVKTLCAENRKNIQFKKSFHREYFFGNTEKKVCKKFFIGVLQISATRIEKCVKRKQMKENDFAIDRRGKHKSHKKIPADKIRNVIKFMNSLPQYESHYIRARESNSGRKYLSPNLNLKIIYNEYKNVCDEKNEKPVLNYVSGCILSQIQFQI